MSRSNAPLADSDLIPLPPRLPPEEVARLVTFAHEELRGKQRLLFLLIVKCNGSASFAKIVAHPELEWPEDVVQSRYSNASWHINSRLEKIGYELHRHQNCARLRVKVAKKKRVRETAKA